MMSAKAGDVPVRWGVIGTGGISRRVVPDLLQTNNVELMAVSSRSEEKADAFAREFSVPRSYGTLTEMVDDPDIDALYIGTPMSSHFDVAKLALERGRHVLCEKSFTVSAAEARELAALALDNRVFLMEAMWMRFTPAILTVSELLRDGAIGEVKAVFASFGIPTPDSPGSRYWDPIGGGALLDLGVYAVTLAHLFLGQPTGVVANGEIRDNGVDVTAAVQLTTASGGYAQLATSIGHFLPPSAVLAGTGGIIAFEYPFYNAPAITISTPERRDRLELSIEGNGYVPMFREVSRTIAAGHTEHALNPLSSTIEVLETIDEVRRQLRNNHGGQ